MIAPTLSEIEQSYTLYRMRYDREDEGGRLKVKPVWASWPIDDRLREVEGGGPWLVEWLEFIALEQCEYAEVKRGKYRFRLQQVQEILEPVL